MSRTLLPGLENLDVFSGDQKHFLKTAKSPINLAYGSVRSGKNLAEAVRMGLYARYEPYGFANTDLAFCGTSSTAVHRLILRDLFKVVGEGNYQYNSSKGVGRIFNRDFYVFGYKDAASFKALRGSTLGGALLTELTLCHEVFWEELNFRCSIPGARIYTDTNPGGPNHWVYKKLITNQDLILPDRDGIIQLKPFFFSFESNPTLDEGYRRKIYAMYPPGTLLHKRMVKGEWAKAEGMVFDNFSEANYCTRDQIPFDQITHYIVGGDYGTKNPFVLLLIGVEPTSEGFRYWVIKEFYYEGRKTGKVKRNSEYRKDLEKFIEGVDIAALYFDPSATGFLAELDGMPFSIESVDNSELPGIECLIELIGSLRLRICKEDCPNYVDEILSYIWDEKAQDRGQDKPVDKDNHGQDAARYACYNHELNPPTPSSFWKDLGAMLA